MEPRPRHWHENGLRHHVLEWGEEGGPTALLVHGFQDCAATWDDVARPLAEAGLRVLVPDMRGFGDGPRVPSGGYYYFTDYVADVAAIVRAHAPGVPLFAVGHSMGATVVSYYAGAFPERVTKVALLDGVGPPSNPFDVAPLRARRWIEMLEERGDRAPRSMTRADALSRLMRFNPDLPEAVLARRLTQLASVGPDGLLAWKYDPLHATTSPIPFYGEAYNAFARRITCPVLHVSGGAMGYHVPEEAERLASFANLTRVTIEAGHALHWARPEELAARLLEFWRA